MGSWGHSWGVLGSWGHGGHRYWGSQGFWGQCGGSPGPGDTGLPGTLGTRLLGSQGHWGHWEWRSWVLGDAGNTSTGVLGMLRTLGGLRVLGTPVLGPGDMGDTITGVPGILGMLWGGVLGTLGTEELGYWGHQYWALRDTGDTTGGLRVLGTIRGVPVALPPLTAPPPPPRWCARRPPAGRAAPPRGWCRARWARGRSTTSCGCWAPPPAAAPSSSPRWPPAASASPCPRPAAPAPVGPRGGRPGGWVGAPKWRLGGSLWP